MQNKVVKVNTAMIHEVEAIPVGVKVSLSDAGLPDLAIIGMAQTQIPELKERVRTAIRCSGFKMPNKKVVVNLGSSDSQMRGTQYDLPIALGILVLTEQIPASFIDNRMFVGELSLDGTVRHVKGMLEYGILADWQDLTLVSDGSEGIPNDKLTHLQFRQLKDALFNVPLEEVKSINITSDDDDVYDLDFSYINGQGFAKRAIEIAVAGGHSLMLIGPKDADKDGLIERIPTVFPSMSVEEKFETALVHSIKGENIEAVCKGKRPLRNPHSSSIMSSILGGGKPLNPGECSLAHNGVLWLDEMLTFKRETLKCLKQPLRCGKVCLTRADGNYVFPSNFMLVASVDATLERLKDSDSMRNVYALTNNIIDMYVNVRPMSPERKANPGNGTDSATLRAAVENAREFKAKRIQKDGAALKIEDACKMTKYDCGEALSMIEQANFNHEEFLKILNIARTIADMGQSERVTLNHVAEAAGYARLYA